MSNWRASFDQMSRSAERDSFDADLLAPARRLGTATLHEAAGRIGALPSAIKPTASSFVIAGPAFPVHCPPNDNLWIHRALGVAKPGDILVVYASGFHEAGYWGEVMSTAAQSAGLGGLVIDGCVRDGRALELCGFPVFARGLCIRGTGKDFGATGWLGRPVMLGDIVIRPGDLMVGDLDGVVCIPRARVSEVVRRSEERDAAERGILDRLRAGESTLDIYRLDR
jgi:4-hydroxy-4-methyl-2-oxoglutarate aldolase